MSPNEPVFPNTPTTLVSTVPSFLTTKNLDDSLEPGKLLRKK